MMHPQLRVLTIASSAVIVTAVAVSHIVGGVFVLELVMYFTKQK